MKTKWRVFFGILVLALLIYLLRKINLKEIWLLISEANVFYFVLAFLCIFAGFFIFNLRAKYSLRNVVKAKQWFFLKTTFAGYFANTITPGTQLAGDIVKAHFLSKKYKKTHTKIYGALLADRFFHGLVSTFFIISSIIYILTFIPVSYQLKIILETILFFLILLAAGIIFINVKKINFNWTRFIEKIRLFRFGNERPKKGKSEFRTILTEHLKNFTRSFNRTLTNKKTFFVAILLSFVYWILFYANSYLLFRALGVHVGFFLVIVVVSLAEIVSDFSPSPGGIGLIEGVMAFTYSLLGVDISAAIAVALLSRMIFYLFSLVIGGLSLINLEKNLG